MEKLFALTMRPRLRPIYILQFSLAAAAITVLLGAIADYPMNRATLALLLGFYVALLIRKPSSWMIILPILVPVLDLAPLSGRIFFAEFDLFLLTTVAVSLARTEPWAASLRFSSASWMLILVLVVWQGYTTLNGLLPIPDIDANSFTSYYSQFNALRIAKGFIGALLLLPALGQALFRQEPVARLVTFGALASLVAGMAVILWERELFTGLLNFSTPYRVTGLFSIMATGGAPIDAHLLISIPFTYWLMRQPDSKLVATGIILLLLALYCVAVTYSRANYPALLLSALSGTGIWMYLNRHGKTPVSPARRKYLSVASVVVVLASIPLFANNYIADRFTSMAEDLEGRFTHWQWSTRIMDDSIRAFWIGMGKGAFPRTYYLHRPDGDMPSTIEHRAVNSQSFIEMGKSHPSGNMSLRQRFAVSEPGPYRISVDLKPNSQKPARLLIEVCERIIYQPYEECRWTGINTLPGVVNWRNYNASIDVSGLGERHLLGSRPVDIAILDRGLPEGLNIDNFQLITPTGKRLLKNSDFDSGLDHWFLYSGDHLSWHIKNMWFDAFFEGGIIGLLVLLLLVGAIAFRLYQRMVERDEFVIPLASAFAGVMVVGAFDSVFDSPRIGFMLYFLAWVVFSANSLTTFRVEKPAQSV